MLVVLRNLGRLLRMAYVLGRHDALFAFAGLPVAGTFARLLSRRGVPGRPGQRLAAALQELGPSFIKFGQALSTRSDLVGEQMSLDLSLLQDRLPPFPSDQARAILAEELGRPVEVLFSCFEDQPVAAASIAQVHFAVTPEGREVAVKILRPGIDAAFARDFELFTWAAAWIARQPAARRLKPVESVHIIEETVRTELDLRLEAAAASEMAANFAGDPTYRVPAVDWSRTARRVLTMERVTGLPVDEKDALIAAGHDLDAILAKAANAFFNQVFRDGFFHADLHPGNLFVDRDGNLVVVDFGIMGRLTERTRRFLGDMLVGFLTRDYRRVAEVHFAAGYVPADQSIDLFTQACRSIGEPILGLPLHEISVARLLGQLFQVTKAFNMEVQPQLLLLQKTMLIAEGVGRTLNPHLNMWELARPLIEDWMRETTGPAARLRNAAEDLHALSRLVPRLLENAEIAAAMIADGGLKLHPQSLRDLALFTQERRAPWIYLAAGAALLGLVAGHFL